MKVSFAQRHNKGRTVLNNKISKIIETWKNISLLIIFSVLYVENFKLISVCGVSVIFLIIFKMRIFVTLIIIWTDR